MGIAAIALAAAIGVVWMQALLGGRSVAAVLRNLGLGLGLGPAALSAIYFLMLAMGVANRWLSLGLETALLAAGVVLVLRAKPEAPQPAAARHPWMWALVAAYVVAGMLFFATAVTSAQANPQGNWDAWGTWNLRARLLAGGPELWRGAVSPALYRSHPDYPLLLPAMVARAWTLGGVETGLAEPITLSLLFMAAVMLLLPAALAESRSWSSAMLGGFLLLTTTSWAGEVNALYADVPMSFFMLAALVLAVEGVRRDCPGRLALAGLSAGFASFLKDEGVAFLLVCAAMLLLSMLRAGAAGAVRRFGWFAAGAVPMALVTLWFKLALAPSSALLAKQPGAQAVRKLAETARFGTVLQSAFDSVVVLGWMYAHPVVFAIVAVYLLRLRKTSGASVLSLYWPVAALGLQLVAYVAVFLATPTDLTWHPATTALRLLIQVVPAAAFAIMLALRTPEELAGQ